MGGTKILALAVNGGRVSSRRRIPTPPTYREAVRAISGLVSEVSGGDPPGSVGVCAPGTPPGLGSTGAGNARCLDGMPLGPDLEAALGMPITLENDADCFTLAESLLGAGRGFGLVLGAVFGTGVGSGLVREGRISRDKGAAHEWGHSVMQPGGARCGCGGRGCVEAYLGGASLAVSWRQMVGGRMGAPGGAGDAWRARVAADLATCLAGLARDARPDVLVVGGGVADAGLLDAGMSYARRLCGVPVARGALGADAGALGACISGTAAPPPA